jgi:hypothetical protein
MLRTAASAPALICRRLLHRNVLLQLKTETRDAVFLLPMTKLRQHINLPSLLLTSRQQRLPMLRLKRPLSKAKAPTFRAGVGPVGLAARYNYVNISS